MKIEKFLSDVHNEIDRSRSLHGNLGGSLHEAYAVILEEFDEFWDEVKKKQHDHNLMYWELVQVAAMCAKTVEDCLTLED